MGLELESHRDFVGSLVEGMAAGRSRWGLANRSSRLGREGRQVQRRSVLAVVVGGRMVVDRWEGRTFAPLLVVVPLWKWVDVATGMSSASASARLLWCDGRCWATIALCESRVCMGGKKQ